MDVVVFMKNKLFTLSQEERTPLCKLGLNITHIMNDKAGNKHYDILDIINEIVIIRELLSINNYDKIETFLRNKILKKETLFKGVYKIKNNFNELRVHKCLKNDENKSVILERLDLILFHLNLLNNSK